MEYTTLGKTGLRISQLGFGGIPIQKIDAAGTKVLMTRLRDAGVNYIDTARAYTVSESFLGEALEGIRDDFILATKSMARDKASMAKDIDISLGNLKTDHIELYQVHNPSVADLEKVRAPGGALEALTEARAAGRIGHLGVTCHSTEVLEKALELSWVETVMFPYNIVETQGEKLMKKAKEKNIGFIVMKPLGGGAIDDATLALRFILQNDAVSVVIPGMAEEREIEQNLAACRDKSPLTRAELEKINAIRDQLGGNFCRRCNYCAPCAKGISMPNVFLSEGYWVRYGLESYARSKYDGLSAHASDCIGCGACESRCPYDLPIRQMLKKVKELFGY